MQSIYFMIDEDNLEAGAPIAVGQLRLGRAVAGARGCVSALEHAPARLRLLRPRPRPLCPRRRPAAPCRSHPPTQQLTRPESRPRSARGLATGLLRRRGRVRPRHAFGTTRRTHSRSSTPPASSTCSSTECTFCVTESTRAPLRAARCGGRLIGTEDSSHASTSELDPDSVRHGGRRVWSRGGAAASGAADLASRGADHRRRGTDPGAGRAGDHGSGAADDRRGAGGANHRAPRPAVRCASRSTRSPTR